MNKVREPESSADKKFSTIMLLIALVGILIVVLVNIPWGGKGAKVAKEYDYLKNDNVFVTVKGNKLKEMIENGENFYLYIGSNKQTDADYFVYYADQLAKRFGIDKIYYFSLNKMSTTDLEFIRENSINELSIEVPNMIYFVKDETSGKSKSYRISNIENFEEYYGSNYWLLLKDFFENCSNASLLE